MKVRDLWDSTKLVGNVVLIGLAAAALYVWCS